MAITLGVGPVTGGNSGFSSTLVLTLTGVTAGRSIVVGCTWQNIGLTLNSVSCTSESNLTLHTQASGPSNVAGPVRFASLANVTTSGDKTITFTWSGNHGGSDYAVGFAFEVAGADTSSFFDKVASTGNYPSTSTTPSTSITPTNDNALIVGFADTNYVAGTCSAGSGYTGISLATGPSSPKMAEYKLDAGTAGANTVDFSLTNADYWVVQAAAFNAADSTHDGTLTKTEASDTLVATGTVAVSGSLTKTEASDTVAAEGIEGSFVVGALTKTEAADTVSSAGNVPVNGAVTKTEAGDTSTATTTVANTGNATGTLPMLTILASSGDGADITLPLLTIEADGIAGAAGTLESILPSLQSTGIGTGDNTGALAVDLPALTLVAGDGGGLIETLPAIVLDATSLTGGVGTLTDALPALTLAAVGDFTNIGTLSATLSSLQGYATGVHGVVAEAAIVLPALRLETAGEAGEAATAALVLPLLTLSAAGHPPSTGTAILVLPSLLLSASGAPTLPATYRTWVVNLKTRAVTEYTGFTFNSYANFDGRVLAASGSGVFELNSAIADNTTDIDAIARTGKHAYETSYLKRVPRLYLSYSAPSGDLEVRTITSEDGRRRYLLRHNGITEVQQRRVPVGKGPKSKFWQFEVANRNGSDFELDGVIVYPQVLGVRAQ